MVAINRIGGPNPEIPEITATAMYAGKVGTLMTQFEDDDAVTKKFVDDIINVIAPSSVDPTLYLDQSGVRAMEGPLNVRDFPKADFEAVNNGYVNAVAAPGQTSLSLELVLPDVKKTLNGLVVAQGSALGPFTVSTGDIVQSTDPNTPVSYLRANGAILNSADYPSLYSIVADRFYKAPPTIGAGTPWKSQYEFNLGTDATIANWAVAGSIYVGVYAAIGFATKNKAYQIGGFTNNGVITPGIRCYDINPDGTVQPSVGVTSFPRPIGTGCAVAFNNVVYVIGGVFENYSVSADVYKATINPDGTLGAWSIHNTLPGAVTFNAVVKAKGRVYCIGGGHTRVSATTSVYSAPVAVDGTLGAWEISTNLPTPANAPTAVVLGDYLYVIGGDEAASDGAVINDRTAKVYRATLAADGTIGAWSTYSPLPIGVAYAQAVVVKNRIHLIGGYKYGFGSSSTTVFTAPIDSSGNIGAWTTGPDLAVSLAYSQAVVTNSRVYLFGGVTQWGRPSNDYYSGTFSGGLNDYSPYYSSGLNAGEFMLPDYTAIDAAKPGQHSYIKYA